MFSFFLYGFSFTFRFVNKSWVNEGVPVKVHFLMERGGRILQLSICWAPLLLQEAGWSLAPSLRTATSIAVIVSLCRCKIISTCGITSIGDNSIISCYSGVMDGSDGNLWELRGEESLLWIKEGSLLGFLRWALMNEGGFGVLNVGNKSIKSAALCFDP